MTHQIFHPANLGGTELSPKLNPPEHCSNQHYGRFLLDSHTQDMTHTANSISNALPRDSGAFLQFNRALPTLRPNSGAALFQPTSLRIFHLLSCLIKVWMSGCVRLVTFVSLAGEARSLRFIFEGTATTLLEGKGLVCERNVIPCFRGVLFRAFTGSSD